MPTSPPDGQNPFWHYQCSFDAPELLNRFACNSPEPTAGMVTNYLGVKFAPKIYPAVLDEQEGAVESMPSPANWHADIAEWAAALRAVELSKETFVAVELGCGWGCWLNITGVAARNVGREVKLIGVEGDAGHVRLAHEALSDNGFRQDQFDLYHAIVGSTPGTALFPKRLEGAVHWGLEPIFDAPEDDVQQARETGSHEVLDIIPLSRIIAEHGPIDLLHVDIQGGEADLIENCRKTVGESVRYLVIGTHSRVIEGRLERLLLEDGWHFEVDRPAIRTLENGAPHLSVDGVQGWRNPRRCAGVAEVGATASTDPNNPPSVFRRAIRAGMNLIKPRVLHL